MGGQKPATAASPVIRQLLQRQPPWAPSHARGHEIVPTDQRRSDPGSGDPFDEVLDTCPRVSIVRACSVRNVDIYSHVLAPRNDEAAAATDRVISG